MPRDYEFLQKEELGLLPLRDRLRLGLKVCRSVFQYLTVEYVEVSCQGPAMRLVEGYLQKGVYEHEEAQSIRENWGVFYDQADYGLYRDYGSGWTFSGISLLDDLTCDDLSTIGTTYFAPQAFAGVQLYRQNLSPFDPVIRQHYQEYIHRLADPVHRMFRRLYDDIRRSGGAESVDWDAFTLDLNFPLLPEVARRQSTWQAPSAEYANLQRLGLAGRLEHARCILDMVSAPAWRDRLIGTIGADPTLVKIA